MLVKASAISGYSISATDGHLGKVADFYFDDERWIARWLVVDTSHWLTGRKVLLPVSALGHPNTDDKTFSVRLTKRQIKDSPDIDTEMPVSRQMEGNVFDYYGWNPYWDNGMYMVGSLPISPPMIPKNPEAIRADEIIRARDDHGDPHLRSIKAVTGHHIHAWDGEIGHVKDFILEDADWTIRFVVVDTMNWWPGKKVLISPRSVKGIDWQTKLVNMDVSRAQVKASPDYDDAITVDRAYERQFHGYYNETEGERKSRRA
jgi:hypothetical protein